MHNQKNISTSQLRVKCYWFSWIRRIICIFLLTLSLQRFFISKLFVNIGLLLFLVAAPGNKSFYHNVNDELIELILNRAVYYEDTPSKASWYLGYYYYLEGNTYQAILTWSEIPAYSADMLIAKGRQAFDHIDYETAEMNYQLGLTLYPQSGDGYCALGRLYNKMEHIDSAIAAYKKGIDTKNISAVHLVSCHYEYGKLLILRQNWAEAMVVLAIAAENVKIGDSKAVSIFTDYGLALYHNSNDSGLMQKQFITALEYGASDLWQYVRYAQLGMQFDEWEVFNYWRNKLVEVSPHSAWIDILDGERYFREGEYQEAIAVLGLAVEKAPDNASAHYWLAWSYLRKAVYPEALDHATIATQINPLEFWQWILLGDINNRMERYSDAMHAYREAFSLAPNHEVVLQRLKELESME